MGDFILIGGGGHARVVMDALASQGTKPAAYSDSNDQPWLSDLGVKTLSPEAFDALKNPSLVLGFLGVSVEALVKRYEKMKTLQAAGARFLSVVHKSAIISPSAVIEGGAQVLTGAIVHAGARIGAGAVVNTGAVVEHGVSVAAGAHVAPRAVVLGDATVGECCFIGAGAVIIQRAALPDQQFVKALTTYR